MNQYKIISKNTDVISHLKKICVMTLMNVSERTDGLVDTKTKTAASLDTTVKLIDAVVEHELIRRYGEKA